MAFHYQIELRNLNDELIDIFQREVKGISWRYDSIGGCGDCEITLARTFDNYGDIEIDYDVQIWRVENPFGSPGSALPAIFTSSGIQLGAAFASSVENRWSGFIREIAPNLDEIETVVLRCSGYVRQAEYIVVPAQTYQSQDVGAAARAIVDSYVIPGTRIKRTSGLNLMQDVGISISSTGLRFDTSAYEAIKTLAEIGGNAEWGVRADKEIYFLPRSTTVKQAYLIGDRIKFYQHSKSADDIVNWVYLRGGSGFTATLQNGAYATDRQKERVVFVAAISNATDATIWGTAYFARFGSAQPKATLRLGSSEAWIEKVTGQTMPPLGRLRILGGPMTIYGGDKLPAQLPFQLGSNIAGFTDMTYRVNSISYTPTETGLNIDIDLGEKRGALADLLRGIEFKISELRQVV